MPRLRPYAIRNTPTSGAPAPTWAAPPKPEDLTANQLARRTRIVEAGVTLMRSRDYEDIQIREVAVEASLALGTVYRYFASKEHLFSEVFFAWLTDLSHEIEAEPATGADNRDRLNDVLARTIAAFEHEPTFYKLLVMTSRTSDPFVRDTRAAMQRNARASAPSSPALPICSAPTASPTSASPAASAMYTVRKAVARSRTRW